MSQTITTAQTEYYQRPRDERFPSLDALVQFSAARKAASREISYNLRDLSITPDPLATDAERFAGAVALQSPKGLAALTPWSHAQICRMVGAPAGYVRTLPAQIAADALNHGMHSAAAVGTTAVILAERQADTRAAHAAAFGAAARDVVNGQEHTVRARSITSDTYGRLWDADLLTPLASTLGSHGWSLPPTWDGEPAGAYAGDRDSFVILVDGGSIVQDPSLSAKGNGQLYRGIMLRNSEVGAAAVSIQTVLYQYVCGNHCLWGAVLDRQYRRRHVGTRVLRDTLREIGTIARQWIARPASADEQIIRQLITLELASSQAAVIDELRKMGATEQDAKDAYATCERDFAASPRSFWGIHQGLTKVSQADGYQDARLVLDQIAAKVLTKGARLVAAA